MPKQIVVMGAGVGGISAAIHARLLGHEVLLLESSDRVGGKAAAIHRDGFRLDPGPSIIILTRIYKQLFEAAGRRMEEYLRFKRLDPISRVYFEGDRIDLPDGPEACGHLIQEVAPQDAKSFRTLMAKLDKVSPHIDKSVFDHPYSRPWQLAEPHLIATALQFNVRLTYRELVDEMFQSPLLRSFFYGFPSYGGQTYDSKAPGALMIPYLMIKEGVFYPEGGVGAIPVAMEKLAAELGVEFRLNQKVFSLEEKDGIIRAAKTSAGRIEADLFISNIDRLTTRAWLGHQVDWAPSLSYFTVHWGLETRLNGLSHHTLIVPPNWERGFEQLYRDRKFPEPPILYLNETAEQDPTCAPPGGTNLFAVITSPSKEPHLDWVRDEAAHVGRVVDIVRAAGIDLDPSRAVFQRVQSPEYFEATHGNFKGSLYGPDEKHRMFGGLFPLSNQDEQYRNLFYCGGSVQPGAGLPMVTLSGKFAAKAAHNS